MKKQPNPQPSPAASQTDVYKQRLMSISDSAVELTTLVDDARAISHVKFSNPEALSESEAFETIDRQFRTMKRMAKQILEDCNVPTLVPVPGDKASGAKK